MFKKLLILLVIATIALGAYEYYKIRVKGYPVKTYLLSNQNRLLPVLIKGRTNSHLHFTRRHKSKLYFYQIEDLHRISQLQVKLYPIKTTINSTDEDDKIGVKIRPGDAQKLAQHAKVVARIEGLQRQLNLTESKIEERSIKREIDRTLMKLWKIEKDLFQSGIDFQPYNNKKDGTLKKLINLVEKIKDRTDLSEQ